MNPYINTSPIEKGRRPYIYTAYSTIRYFYHFFIIFVIFNYFTTLLLLDNLNLPIKNFIINNILYYYYCYFVLLFVVVVVVVVVYEM